ncbi:TetR/AcrR family transcriptional regulator [Nocardioides gilvus]|uniref:TetR/AcrR family transcriptional regulator n=1 Tax=Nocardioides gilvus TaxID=1735589 RepID=UPI000D7471C6|nr:TetR/AcrR family transcriptional regulator [Nocardioides gilvus]
MASIDETTPQDPATATNRRQEFSTATKRDLVETARRHFTDHGYTATSLDTIVAGARVTKGALYHHFTNKQDLFLAVHEAIETDAVRRIDAVLGQYGDPWQAATHGLQTFLEIAREPEYRRIVVEEGAAVLGSARPPDSERSTFSPVRHLVRATLTSGDWDVPEEMIDTFSRIFFGALNSAGQSLATSAEPEEETIRIETSVGLLLAAVRHLSTTHESLEAAVLPVLGDQTDDETPAPEGSRDRGRSA